MPRFAPNAGLSLSRLAAAVGALAAMAIGAAANTAREPDVMYFPTPQVAVDRMLEMADLKEGDVLIDLGSGDGRIPITAATRYGIRALGVDIDSALVAAATEAAERKHVADKVVFKEQDLFETDLSEATVITMFLLGSVNLKLRPALMRLKPGTRILSYNFNMGDWEPDRRETVDGRNIYLWIVRENMGDLGPTDMGAN